MSKERTPPAAILAAPPTDVTTSTAATSTSKARKRRHKDAETSPEPTPPIAPLKIPEPSIADCRRLLELLRLHGGRPDGAGIIALDRVTDELRTLIYSLRCEVEAPDTEAWEHKAKPIRLPMTTFIQLTPTERHEGNTIGNPRQIRIGDDDDAPTLTIEGTPWETLADAWFGLSGVASGEARFDERAIRHLERAVAMMSGEPAAAPGTTEARPAAAASGGDCGAAHSTDFRSVRWHGEDFVFTAIQARIVSFLWAARDNGTPDLGYDTLLEKADSETKRLVDVFKKHPAWGTMIVAGETKGTCRLATDFS